MLSSSAKISLTSCNIFAGLYCIYIQQSGKKYRPCHRFHINISSVRKKLYNKKQEKRLCDEAVGSHTEILSWSKKNIFYSGITELGRLLSRKDQCNISVVLVIINMTCHDQVTVLFFLL